MRCIKIATLLILVSLGACTPGELMTGSTATTASAAKQPVPAGETAAVPATAAAMPAPAPGPAPDARTSPSPGSTAAGAPTALTPPGVPSGGAASPATGTSTARARPPAAATANPAAAVRPAPLPAPAAAAANAPPRPPAAPALDLSSLEQRLRDTRAIGVFTKLSIKNQVDDLLDRFRAFYKSATARSPPPALRQQYELLFIKVVTVVQDGDPPLASAISSSREAIWGILADPKKFAQI